LQNPFESGALIRIDPNLNLFYAYYENVDYSEIKGKKFEIRCSLMFGKKN